jgi:hypothetical protein
MRHVLQCFLSLAIFGLLFHTPAAAARPPFRQCNAAVYNGEALNCNILITIDRNGNLSADGDPNRPWYPPASSPTPGPVFDVGQLIGFQNNSSAPVYSLTLSYPAYTNTNGAPTPLCYPKSPGPYNAPNVRIINIPDHLVTLMARTPITSPPSMLGTSCRDVTLFLWGAYRKEEPPILQSALPYVGPVEAALHVGPTALKQ